MTNMTNPYPTRRWYQYSLRSLFILTTLVAFACSWYAVEMQNAAERRAAIKEIKKLRGLVGYYHCIATITSFRKRQLGLSFWRD